MRKLIYIFLCLTCAVLLFAQAPQLTFRYWFDNNESAATTQAAGNQLELDINLDALAPALHSIHLQVVDGDDVASSPATRYFVKLPKGADGITKYWFDNDESTQHTVNASEILADIDVSQLSDGLHMLHVQGIGASPSAAESTYFLKVPQWEGVSTLKCVTSVDGVLYKQEDVPASGGVIHYDFDAKGLSEGVHQLIVQVITPSGAASSVGSSYFLRVNTTEELSLMRCYYSVDGTESFSEAGAFDNGLFHFDLNVADLTDGLHTITYLLATEGGMATSTRSAFFVKIPLGGEGITAYEYWVNDRFDQKKTTQFSKRVSAYDLVSLLPVDEQPIRSADFHFEWKSGKPYIYAQNDFHVRFHDAAGRFTEAAASYTDPRVGHEITDAALLASGSPVTKQKPGVNEIQWYHFPVLIGDSLAFKVNQACTVQVFAPSGQEVYKANGPSSVAWGGLHALEAGEYYLALHDVASPYASTTRLEYEHIDRYALLSHTPDEVGAAPGVVHLSLFGNGYDKLANAKLKRGSTELWCADIEAEDYAHASLSFHIPNGNITRGDYDLILEFEDGGETEQLVCEGALGMVEPVYGDIKVKVTSRPTIASPYPVTVTVTNTGNVEYQMVPLYMAWDDVPGLQEVGLMNARYKAVAVGSSDHINPLILTNNLLGNGTNGMALPVVLPTLGGGQSANVVVGFISDPHTRFNFYAWPYTPMSHSGDGGSGGLAGLNENPLCDFNPCDVIGMALPTLADCFCNVAWADIQLIGGIYVGVANNWAKKQNEWLAQNPDVDYFLDGARYSITKMVSPEDLLRDVLSGCTPTPQAVSVIQGMLEAMAEDDCPQPEPHPVDVYMPGDPNDMLGYLAPSGSHYIKKGIEEVSYTIEFENDPEIANAAAHHIVITNRIDGSKLDLASMQVKSMKLAHRTVDLSGLGSNFTTTIDMRPDINSLAQVTQTFDASTGLATWDILALDPMSLDPTDDIMQGILPVNDGNGRGVGEIIYDINLKPGLAHGTTISNSASIKFDNEDVIDTPVWDNITDYTLPTSRVVNTTILNPTKMMIELEGSDTGSGLWKYDIYMRAEASGAWTLLKDGLEPGANTINIDTRQLSGAYVCSIAYDLAGNAEDKALADEAQLTEIIRGDANGDGFISIADNTVIVNELLGRPNASLVFEGADADGDGVILISDATSVINSLLGKSGRAAAPMHKRGAAEPERILAVTDVALDANGLGSATLSINETGRFTALQVDAELPYCLNIAAVELNPQLASTHQLAWAEVDEGKVRILVYSMQNSEIDCADVASITVKAKDGAQATGQLMLFVDAFLSECTDTQVEQTESATATSIVTGSTSSLRQVAAEGMTVAARDKTIIVKLESDAEVIITDASGISAAYSLKQGENHIKVASAGVYMVNSFKILVE